MVKLNVKVPKRPLEEIDAVEDELEYPNRSKFIREVLRDTTEPILTPGIVREIRMGARPLLPAGRCRWTRHVTVSVLTNAAG